MKRGSSVLQPPCDAAKRLVEDVGALSAAPDAEPPPPPPPADGRAAGSSPFPAATSLFSPDVSTKMASDLLIRLSEATQKAQLHPGSREEAEPQDEPGPALSPDGPGASPEPPSLTHTPDGNAATDTLASDLLRKLAERQEESGLVVRLKEEEEPMEVDAVAQSRPIAEEVTTASRRAFAVKTEEEEEDRSPPLLQVKVEDVPEANGFQFRVKMEDGRVPGATAEDRLPSGAKMDDQQLFFGAKMEDQCLRAVLWQDMSVNLASTLLHQLSERAAKSGALQVDRMAPPTRSSPVVKVEQLHPSPPLLRLDPPHETASSLSRDQSTSSCSFFFRCHVCGFETEGPALFQSHMTEHRQWEHGSFSLHCCTCDHAARQEAEMRAHLETHLQGDLAEMRCPGALPAAAAAAASSSAPAVAVATQPEPSASEHRCRICQRSFPGQPELLVHFQGHRQGNQYRCDRCGHLTRTANKLVEHVRVHTGERPFTCDLCPYSAKRRDSLRLHRKVKHAAAAAAAAAHGDAPGDHVHTHRSYVHADNQRPNKHLQRLHTPLSTSSSSSLPPLHPALSERAGWRELSPLLPITTLLSLKPRCSSSSSSSSCSSSSLPTKHSFLGYLGLTTL